MESTKHYKSMKIAYLANFIGGREQNILAI